MSNKSKGPKIAVISFYFPPDLAAGSFRANMVFRQLVKQLPASSSVNVFAAQNVRYPSYKFVSKPVEYGTNFQIYRLKVPIFGNSNFGQIISFCIFFFKTIFLCRKSKYDVVFCTTSRLMTGCLGALIAKKTKAKLYLDLRDVFVEVITDVYPKLVVKLLSPLLNFLESKVINSAARINLVSEGFLPYFKAKYGDEKTYSCFTNCIRSEFLSFKHPEVYSRSQRIKTIIYAGNIGEGQGLEKILPSLAKMLGDKYFFKIIGDGRRLEALRDKIDEEGVNNIFLSKPVNPQYLLEEYKNADILFLHLNNCIAFERVLPSKIFEYGATGKPILAGVSGYAKEFVIHHLENVETFVPCSASSAFGALYRLSFDTCDRSEFVKKFSCENVIQGLVSDILIVVNQ